MQTAHRPDTVDPLVAHKTNNIVKIIDADRFTSLSAFINDGADAVLILGRNASVYKRVICKWFFMVALLV